MRGYPQVSFWISITLGKIYLSCIIINQDKNSFELVGTVLKTRIFALEASLLGQIFVLRTSNFRGATISRYDSSSTETLYCLNNPHFKFYIILSILTLLLGRQVVRSTTLMNSEISILDRGRGYGNDNATRQEYYWLK